MTCEIHYWTAPWGRGHGYAAEAARAAAAWALRDRGFARVSLFAVVQNAASRKVADAAGFRFEGILRNAALTRAGRADLATYSLIPGDLE
jgi:ribosomal-protein-alanine N-acetyltransferase